MTAQLTTSREERGQVIAQSSGQVKRIDECLYVVKSQSNNGEYTVNKVNGEWLCDCPDNTYRHVPCKHIHAVSFSKTIRAEVAINRVIPEITVQACQYCGHYFTINLGFERMRATPQIITSAMQLYFTGESLRNVQKFLKLQGVTVSHVAVMKWIKKYVRLMSAYVEKMKPNVSDTWRADELYIKVKGDMKYLFAMDDETRFWIAQEVAETKEKHDARTLFFRAKRLMGKQPKTLITDGLPSYSVACEQVFDGTKHVRKITFDGKVHNNNKMERMNGEIRDREKTMRGLKRKRTPILQGYQIYHNYIREHEALNGKTPSEACGITIEGKNKWITLIQNASKEKQGVDFK
jgi:putative transposase